MTNHQNGRGVRGNRRSAWSGRAFLWTPDRFDGEALENGAAAPRALRNCTVSQYARR
ncbi:hypothetical protein BH24PSE1_BH24PSE1_08870 [soil metagenome]